MILGLRTVVYKVPDLAKAREWYARGGVTDAAAAYARLLELGASAGSPPQDVGGGIRVAAVQDPFGNAFGVIENPHFSAANVR